MVFFTMAACALRCCTMSSTSHDWQRDGLLDNCGDDEAAASEVDAQQQQHSDQQQPRPWWQLSSANSLWKQRLRQSIETLRHFRCHHPPEYTINDDVGGGSGGHRGRGRGLGGHHQQQQQQSSQQRPLRSSTSTSSSSSSNAKDWPLSSLDGSSASNFEVIEAGGGSLETDEQQQSCISHIRPHIRH